MNNKILNDDIDYPFRASLTRVARCGLCKHHDEHNIVCAVGLDIQYPTIAKEHNCPAYEYKKDNFKRNMFQHCELQECSDCAHELDGCCTGKQWMPFKTKPHCEFYRPKWKTCHYAVPHFQEGCGPQLFRNNYCERPPEERDGIQRGDWKCRCSAAHTAGAECLSCYQPMID